MSSPKLLHCFNRDKIQPGRPWNQHYNCNINTNYQSVSLKMSKVTTHIILSTKILIKERYKFGFTLMPQCSLQTDHSAALICVQFILCTPHLCFFFRFFTSLLTKLFRICVEHNVCIFIYLRIYPSFIGSSTYLLHLDRINFFIQISTSLSNFKNVLQYFQQKEAHPF